MICDLCSEKEAFVFIEMQGPATNKKLNLCRDCASKLGVTQDPKSITSLFKELGNLSQSLAISEEDKKACPVCGSTLASIKKTKHAGCPECYAIFSNDIKALLKKQGITGPYTGFMPQRLAGFRSVLTDRIALQTKLEEAIQREDYEKAAVYRDYLKALEKSPVSGSENE